MSLAVLAGIVLVLMGLGSAWVLGFEVVRANRAPGIDDGAPPAPPWPATETWLWLTGWTALGLGLVCFGMTVLRHAQGWEITHPAVAQVIDHVVWPLGIAGACGGLAVLILWLLVRSTQERHRRDDTTTSGDI